MTARMDRRQFLIASGATAGLAAADRSVAAAQIRVTDLRVDYLGMPVGLENSQPQLSWRLESAERDVRQFAYRVLVARSEALLQKGQADLWDSGKVFSQKSSGVQYLGSDLCSRERCLWRVRVWDEHDLPSSFSEVSSWEMGLLRPEDWSAQWLAAEDANARADREASVQRWIWGPRSESKRTRKFRFKFALPERSSGGECFVFANDAEVTGLWLDGAAVDGEVFLDSYTSGMRVRLPSLPAGGHLWAVEVQPTDWPLAMLGHEFMPAFTSFFRVELVKGETLRLGSHGNWKTTESNVSDWQASAYDDAAWEFASEVPLDGYQPWPAQPAMQLRREFQVNQPVLRARLYATALGAYEARLNGRRIGDALLTPEISQYAKRALYRVYDVTAMLQLGTNVLGFTVGDGWYGSFDGRFAWAPPPRQLLAQLELIFANGSRQVVATSPGWRASESPIRRSEIRSGEHRDARLEQPGWDCPGFDDQKWFEAHVAEKPSAALTAQISPPIRAHQYLKVKSIHQPRLGSYVFDFGQNLSGWCRLHTRGPAGTRIELRFAEVLTPTSEVNAGAYTASMGAAKCDVFTLRGAPEGETFEPLFTYRSFRYVQVCGLATAPNLSSMEGVFIHSDLPLTGKLRSESVLVEQIWRMTVRTQRCNFVGIPTDCPSREQEGYLADAGVFWDTAAFNMDVAAFTERFLTCVRDEQSVTGALPIVAPKPRWVRRFRVDGSVPGWSDAAIVLPWTVWQRYGDTSIIERNWQTMTRYLEFILNRNPSHLWLHGRSDDFGDWMAIGERHFSDPSNPPTTPKELIATAYWAYSTQLVVQMADAIGRSEEKTRWQALHQNIRAAFERAFIKPDGTVGNGSQTGYVLALRFGLISNVLKAAAERHLVSEVRRQGPGLTTGILGTQFILDVLTDAGFASLAYELLLKTSYPSWGYMLSQGASTFWESWSGKSEEDSQPIDISKNHFMLGTVGGFLFRRLAGIEPATPGFKRFRIRPVLAAQLRRAGAEYDSIHGRISVDWALASNERFSLSVQVPPNTQAQVHLPAASGATIREGRRPIGADPLIRLIHRVADEAVIEIGSGSYNFLCNHKIFAEKNM